MKAIYRNKRTGDVFAIESVGLVVFWVRAGLTCLTVRTCRSCMFGE